MLPATRVRFMFSVSPNNAPHSQIIRMRSLTSTTHTAMACVTRLHLFHLLLALPASRRPCPRPADSECVRVCLCVYAQTRTAKPNTSREPPAHPHRPSDDRNLVITPHPHRTRLTPAIEHDARRFGRRSLASISNLISSLRSA